MRRKATSGPADSAFHPDEGAEEGTDHQWTVHHGERRQRQRRLPAKAEYAGPQGGEQSKHAESEQGKADTRVVLLHGPCFDQMMFQSYFHRLALAVDTELTEDGLEVVAHRSITDAERRSNITRRIALHQEGEHFLFPCRQGGA